MYKYLCIIEREGILPAVKAVFISLTYSFFSLLILFRFHSTFPFFLLHPSFEADDKGPMYSTNTSSFSLSLSLALFPFFLSFMYVFSTFSFLAIKMELPFIHLRWWPHNI